VCSRSPVAAFNPINYISSSHEKLYIYFLRQSTQREMTSHAFRDTLHEQYTSSDPAKKKRRLLENNKQLQKEFSVPALGAADLQKLRNFRYHQRCQHPNARIDNDKVDNIWGLTQPHALCVATIPTVASVIESKMPTSKRANRQREVDTGSHTPIRRTKHHVECNEYVGKPCVHCLWRLWNTRGVTTTMSTMTTTLSVTMAN
jgi:hypothetical protein